MFAISRLDFFLIIGPSPGRNLPSSFAGFEVPVGRIGKDGTADASMGNVGWLLGGPLSGGSGVVNLLPFRGVVSGFLGEEKDSPLPGLPSGGVS